MVRSTLAVSWPTAAASTSTISGADVGAEPSPGINAIVARSTSPDLANTHAAVRLVIEYGRGVASRWTILSELISAANVALKAASVLVCLDGDPANTFHVVTWLDDAVDARCTSTTYAVYTPAAAAEMFTTTRVVPTATPVKSRICSLPICSIRRPNDDEDEDEDERGVHGSADEVVHRVAVASIASRPSGWPSRPRRRPAPLLARLRWSVSPGLTAGINVSATVITAASLDLV